MIDDYFCWGWRNMGEGRLHNNTWYHYDWAIELHYLIIIQTCISKNIASQLHALRLPWWSSPGHTPSLTYKTRTFISNGNVLHRIPELESQIGSNNFIINSLPALHVFSGHEEVALNIPFQRQLKRTQWDLLILLISSIQIYAPSSSKKFNLELNNIGHLKLTLFSIPRSTLRTVWRDPLNNLSST